MNKKFCNPGACVVTFGSVLMLSIVAEAQPIRGGRTSGGGTSVWKYLAEKHDKDQDGRITKDEYDRGDETFDRLDRTQDGILTADDWNGISGPFGSGPGQRPGDGLRGVAPEQGDVAPDFQLTHIMEPEKTIRLSSFAGVKPVALIFGSCT